MSDNTREQTPEERLLELIFGDQYRISREARHLADWVRVNREKLERGVDDLLALYRAEFAKQEPQEGRVALSALAFRESIREDPANLESILVTMELVVERLATLDADRQAQARRESLAQATPTGTLDVAEEGSRG